MPFASKQAKTDYQREYFRRYRASGTVGAQRYRDGEQRRNSTRNAKARKTPLFLCIDGELSNSVHDGKRRYNIIQLYARDAQGTHLWTVTNSLGVGIIQFAKRLKSIVTVLRQHNPQRTITPVWFAGQFDADQLIGNERSLSLAEKAKIVATHSNVFGVVRTDGFLDCAPVGPEVKLYWGKKSFRIDYLLRNDSYKSVDGVDISEEHRMVVPVAHETGGALLASTGTSESAVASTTDRGTKPKTFRITITDVWSITAKSFVQTIETVCLPHWSAEERAEYLPLLDLIVEGKESRQYANWRGWDQARINSYNRAELVLLNNYCDTLWNLCARTGVYPRSFAGPAPFARALQRLYGVAHHIKPHDYDSIGYQEGDYFKHELCSYYGGRIETAGQGWVHRLYEYDIRSAYPDAERQAPCLAHGQWRVLQATEIEQANTTACINSHIGTYDIQWWYDAQTQARPRWGPLPVRDRKGRVCFPLAGRGWYKGVEVQALMDCWPGYYCIFAGQVWESDCYLEHPRQQMIEETYDKRAELKAAGDGGELVLKLALNSCYGTSAQTAGAYREVNEQGETVRYSTPSTSNITLAAWDTAYVRARIYRAIMASPYTVAAATDAVYATEQVDVGPFTPNLGAWEVKEHKHPVLIVAPGLSVTHDAMMKRRGIGGKVNAASLVDAWDRPSDSTDFVYATSQQRYKDLRASLHMREGHWTLDDDWGEFVTQQRDMDLTPMILQSKRDTGLMICHPPHEFTEYPAYEHTPVYVTVAYRRPFDIDAPQTGEREPGREREIANYGL